MITSGPAKPMDIAVASGTCLMPSTNRKLPAHAKTPRVKCAPGLRMRSPVQRRRGAETTSTSTRITTLRRQMS